ncbi:unnamed protein product [Dovyalis caffra]|uniref:Uncharacterized protein n=1 Tax=Dovyalis caffra TaxID=77055 RepID=A0AAV1R5S6_9ROSI|nr:unnamed protein product [Dovyalis caffra]
MGSRDFESIMDLRKLANSIAPIELSVGWSLPSYDWIKVNTAGALRRPTAGCVLRDGTGAWLDEKRQKCFFGWCRDGDPPAVKYRIDKHHGPTTARRFMKNNDTDLQFQTNIESKNALSLGGILEGNADLSNMTCFYNGFRLDRG